MTVAFCGRCKRSWALPIGSVCPYDLTSLVPLAVAREGRPVEPGLGPTPTLRPLEQAARPYRTARWLPAAWRRLLGAGVPDAGCSVLLYGPPGSGKSTAGLSLLGHAVAHDQGAAYLDGEMGGEGPVLAAIAKAARLSPEARRRLRVAGVGGVSHVDDLLAGASLRVALVDSLQALRAESSDVARWREAVPLLLLVSHVTAEGRVRGGPAVPHGVDVVIEFVAGRGARTAKSRFGAPPGTSVPWADLLAGDEDDDASQPGGGADVIHLRGAGA